MIYSPSSKYLFGYEACSLVRFPQIIAEYTKPPSDTIQIQFPETSENEESILSIKELQDIASAIRITSCLLLPLIMNEDEDNLLAENTSG